jgi:hypothetical protein
VGIVKAQMIDANRAMLFDGSRGFGSIDLRDLMRLNDDEIARVIDLRIQAASSEKGLDFPD